METRREQEDGASFTEHVLQKRDGKIDRNTEGLENVGSAAFRGDPAVAVFDQPGTRAGRDKHDRGRDIEEPELVASRSAHVDHRAQIRWHIEGNGTAENGVGQRHNFGRCLSATMECAEKIRFVFGGDGLIEQPPRDFTNFVGHQLTGQGNFAPIGHGRTSSRRRTNSSAGHWPATCGLSRYP